MMKRNKFQRGGGGVYRCEVCGRSTRLVDQGNNTLCPQCWDLAGIDNSVNDGVQTWAEVTTECYRLLAELVARGGDAKRVKRSCSYLWPQDR